LPFCAKLAFDIFARRLQAGIGSMVAALGGIDALAFTAGIGDNSPEVRQAACAKKIFLACKSTPQKMLPHILIGISRRSPHPFEPWSCRLRKTGLSRAKPGN
jgi:acetate kinase